MKSFKDLFWKNDEELKSLQNKKQGVERYLNNLKLNRPEVKDVSNRNGEICKASQEVEELNKQIKAKQTEIKKAEEKSDAREFPTLVKLRQQKAPLQQKLYELVTREHELNQLWNKHARALESLRSEASNPISQGSMDRFVTLEADVARAKKGVIDNYNKIQKVKQEKAEVEAKIKEINLSIRNEYISIVSPDVDNASPLIKKLQEICAEIERKAGKANSMASDGLYGWLSYPIINPAMERGKLDTIAKQIEYFQEAKAKLKKP